jgi:hypothetical protein
MTDFEHEQENKYLICKDDCVFCPRLDGCTWILETAVCPLEGDVD